jgi:FkbM family methyltransferase
VHWNRLRSTLRSNTTIRKTTHSGYRMDKYIQDMVLSEYAWMMYPGCILADAGSNIGLSIYCAILLGAYYVYGIEPFLDNYYYLKLNVGGFDNVKLQQAALVCSRIVTETTILYVPTNGVNNGSCSTVINSKKRKKVSVPAVCFDTWINGFTPTVLKMDIERAEWGLLQETPVPASVKMMTVEFHFSSIDQKKKDLAWLDRTFNNWYIKYPDTHNSTYPMLVKFIRHPKIPTKIANIENKESQRNSKRRRDRRTNNTTLTQFDWVQ